MKEQVMHTGGPVFLCYFWKIIRIRHAAALPDLIVFF